MEIKLNIEYQELLALIKQLPFAQIRKLREEIDSITDSEANGQENAKLQQLLLNGPVMDEVQYQEFLLNRNHFNTWRAS